MELVYSWELEQALALIRQLAWSKPREGEWERSYRQLQARARKLLGQDSGA